MSTLSLFIFVPAERLFVLEIFPIVNKNVSISAVAPSCRGGMGIYDH